MWHSIGQSRADVSHWPMVLTYATYLWNIKPHPETGLAPLEIFAQSKQLMTQYITHIYGDVLHTYLILSYRMGRNC